jgi:hypothetical protein
MDIAYVTTYDGNDIQKWSGTGYYISEEKAFTLEGSCYTYKDPPAWANFTHLHIKRY